MIWATTTPLDAPARPWRRRVKLVVHPEVSPHEVAAAYTRARTGYVSGQRVRAISRKAAEMVALARERGDASPVELRNAWVSDHPEDGQLSADDLRRWVTRSTRRLLDGP